MAKKDKKQHMCLHKGCLKTFSRPYRLEQHMRVHTGEKPFKCDFPGCEHSYARAAHLKRHKDTAHNRDTPTQSFTCGEDGCKKSFKYEQNLKRHVSVEHEKKNLYRCPEKNCDQFFRKRHQLKAHTFEHKGVLPFQCHFESCEKKFTQRSHLDRHLKVHDGYKCDDTDCQLIFTTWSLYRKHKAIDHKTGPKCPVCGKAFAKKSWLTQHEKTHTPQRPLMVCPREGCERAYAELRNLNHHIRFYHENEGFTCDICKRVLVTKQKLQVHMHTHSPSYAGKQYPRRKGIPRKGKSITSKLTVALTGIDLEKEKDEEPVEVLDSSDTEAPVVNKITVEPVYFSDIDEEDTWKTKRATETPKVTHCDKETVHIETGLNEDQSQCSATKTDIQVSLSEGTDRKSTNICVAESIESCIELEIDENKDLFPNKRSHELIQDVNSTEEKASSGILKTVESKSDFEMSHKKKRSSDEKVMCSGSDVNSSFEEVGDQETIETVNLNSDFSSQIEVETKEKKDKVTWYDFGKRDVINLTSSPEFTVCDALENVAVQEVRPEGESTLVTVEISDKTRQIEQTKAQADDNIINEINMVERAVEKDPHTENESGNSVDSDVEAEQCEKIAQPYKSNEKRNDTNSTSSSKTLLDTGQFAVMKQPIVTDVNNALNNTTYDKLKRVISLSEVLCTKETLLDKNQVVMTNIETTSESRILSAVGIEIVGNEVMATEVDRQTLSRNTDASTEESQDQASVNNSSQEMMIYLTENVPGDSETDTEYVISVEIPEELLPKYTCQDDAHQYSDTTCAAVSSNCAKQNVETENTISGHETEVVGCRQNNVNVGQEDDTVANKNDKVTKRCDEKDKDLTGYVTVHIVKEHQNENEILKDGDVKSSESNVSEIVNIDQGKPQDEIPVDASDLKPTHEKLVNNNRIEAFPDHEKGDQKTDSWIESRSVRYFPITKTTKDEKVPRINPSFVSNTSTIQQKVQSTLRTDTSSHEENNVSGEIKNTESAYTLKHTANSPKDQNMNIERKNGNISGDEAMKGNKPINSPGTSKDEVRHGRLALVRNITRRRAHPNIACARRTLQHPNNSGNPILGNSETQARLSKRVAESIPSQSKKKLCVGSTASSGARSTRDGDAGGSVRDKLSSIIFSAL